MRVAILFSGGKDSVFTLYNAMRQGLEVPCLITMRSANKASYMFHTPAISLTTLQAETIGIPLFAFETKGEKEKELADLEAAIKYAKAKFGFDALGVGALASEYQKERVEKICRKLGLGMFAPLWKVDHEKYLCELIAAGFDVRFVGVAAHGLGEEWLGRKLDAKAIDELCALNKRFGIHVGGEGGEYETLVVDGPIFRKRIALVETQARMGAECTGVLEILEARLVAK